ncbi:NAD(P)-binding domain-containing protein [Methanolobus halotolerans]|uniref:Coenzyme F420:NADP oxidoreductase n=1 Tax=Methanolobus halotolerans TaxID=2052935 RepID=A0A4E0QS84_9EURY|nr:NAD(P)-binding domain-containing protein [Methanolobus halotolerans]TGC09758.1 coenzyme F420:NADP oxidoreductase [Methanolobus halotolerans]
MKIAILGGTGNIGKGFALRWGQKHDMIIGSRNAEKAEKFAAEYRDILKRQGYNANITGSDNKNATEEAEIVVIAIRYNQLRSLIDLITPVIGKQIFISVVVPMEKNLCYISPNAEPRTIPITSDQFNADYFCFTMPEAGSATQEIENMLPAGTELASAFHTVPAKKLADLELELDYDIGVCANSEYSKKVVFGLIKDISRMRPLDTGPLEAAAMLESLTPLIINVAARNKMKDISIKFI